jgi:hypothetical protein
MAFPTVATTNTSRQDTNSLTHTVNLPASIASGNLLLVFFACDGNTTAEVTTPASGWSTLFTQNVLADTAFLKVFYRFANGAEGGTIVITTGATEQSTHISYRITGAHASEVPAFSSTRPGASNANPDPPSLNPANWDIEDTLWIAAAAWDGSPTGTGYPTNYTGSQLTNQNPSGSGSAGSIVATKNNAAASEDPGTFTMSASEQWASATIAVRPAGAGTTYNQSASGAITPAGATLKQDSKVAAGSITPSGAIIRDSRKVAAGSITPVGALAKLTSKLFSGGITPSGALAAARLFVKEVAGSLTPAGTLIRDTAKTLAGSLTPSGALSKLTSKLFSGGLTPTGALSRITNKVVAGVLSLAGAIESLLTEVIDTSTTFEIFILPDDYDLIATEDSFEILAQADDFDLIVPVEQTVYTDWYADANLVDENGDQLVDENGDLLIVPAVSTENVYVVHAPVDDFDIIVNEET